MRAVSRCLTSLLLTAALLSGCNAIPITIPSPSATADSGGPLGTPDGAVAGGDMGSVDFPSSNVPDAGPAPISDGAAADGPALTGDAMADAIGDTLADTIGDGLPPAEGGTPDSLAPDSLAPDSLAPDSLAPDSLAPDSLVPVEGGVSDSQPPLEGGAPDAATDL